MSRHAFWIASVLFAALVLAKFDPQTGFTSLIRFGETWQGRRHSALQNLPIATVPGSNGYDGQFYAQIALDPFLRGPELARVIDAPAYRARRILAPATAAILGFGRPWWILQIYASLNVICWLALGRVLYRQIGDRDWIAFARWAGCMFSLGVLDSVHQSLVDLPALLLLVLAACFLARSRTAGSTLWLALANLAKETSLIGSFALHAEELLNRHHWKRALLTLSVAALPIVLWSCYVHTRLYDPTSRDGWGNFTWPLLGLLGQARISLPEVLHGNLDGRYTFGLLAIAGLSTQAVFLWRTPQLQSPWWRIGAVFSVLFLFLGSQVWSGYWAVCRAVLPMTIAFNLLLPAGRYFQPRWIVGNLTLLHAVWRFL
jgi:hypothetical protein